MVSTRTTSTATLQENRHAYLKWPRMVAFLLTAALGVVATGLNSRAIELLNHDKATLAKLLPGAKLNATDVVSAAAIMTTAAGLTSLYCAALSLVILFRLHREETSRSIRVKEICMAFLALLLLGSCIASSVIIVPRSASITAPGIPSALINGLLKQQGKSLAYKDSIVYKGLIICWLCFAFTLISFVLAALTSRHIQKYGPESTLVGGTSSTEHAHAHDHSHSLHHSTKEAKTSNDHVAA